MVIFPKTMVQMSLKTLMMMTSSIHCLTWVGFLIWGWMITLPIQHPPLVALPPFDYTNVRSHDLHKPSSPIPLLSLSLIHQYSSPHTTATFLREPARTAITHNSSNNIMQQGHEGGVCNNNEVISLPVSHSSRVTAITINRTTCPKKVNVVKFEFL